MAEAEKIKVSEPLEHAPRVLLDDVFDEIKEAVSKNQFGRAKLLAVVLERSIDLHAHGTNLKQSIKLAIEERQQKKANPKTPASSAGNPAAVAVWPIIGEAALGVAGGAISWVVAGVVLHAFTGK
ncbi:MAG: hypothetical protein ACREH5_03200 [Candidatus Omnitrophota bacterium]